MSVLLRRSFVGEKIKDGVFLLIGDGLEREASEPVCMEKGCSNKKHRQKYGVHNMHEEETSWAVDRIWRVVDHMVD